MEPIPIKKLSYIDESPRIMWTDEYVDRMNTNEILHYAVIGKFSYGWPKLKELRTLIPKLINLKGDCKIGFLRNRYILISFNLIKHFVNILSKNVYYLTAKDDY